MDFVDKAHDKVAILRAVELWRIRFTAWASPRAGVSTPGNAARAARWATRLNESMPAARGKEQTDWATLDL